jgi:hypothetical protein
MQKEDELNQLNLHQSEPKVEEPSQEEPKGFSLEEEKGMPSSQTPPETSVKSNLPPLSEKVANKPEPDGEVSPFPIPPEKMKEESDPITPDEEGANKFEKNFGEGGFQFNSQRNKNAKREINLLNEKRQDIAKSERDNPKEDDANIYRLRSKDWLKNRLKQIERDLDLAEQHDKKLTDKIEDLQETMHNAYGLDKTSYRKQWNAAKTERDSCRRESDELETQKEIIGQELQRKIAEKVSAASQGSQATDILSDRIAASSLFENGEEIENTILYVATFFPGLSPSDFKRVVSHFLKGQTKKIITQQQKVLEDGTSKVVEELQERDLVDIWEESFNKPDQFLKKCCLCVQRRELLNLIDFSLKYSYLQEDCVHYFQEQQALYVEERLKATQVLLLDSSESVADHAIMLLAEAASYYPNDYGVQWLLEVANTAEIVVEHSNSAILFVRMAKLLYQMQVVLESSQSEHIVIRFINSLLEKKRDYAFPIVFYLLDRQLRSTRPNLSKQLLDWLQRYLNNSSENSENTDAAYEVLEALFLQDDSYIYIYALLDILGKWLVYPEGTHSDDQEVSTAGMYALSLFVIYCGNTISGINSRKYGCYPSHYPLFISGSDLTRDDMGILCTWLFHYNSKVRLALESEWDTADMEPLELIAIFIAEWFTILYGLDENPNAHNCAIAQWLLQKVADNANRKDRQELIKNWSYLGQAYLKAAANAAKSGKPKSRKEFNSKRKIVQKLRTDFKELAPKD